MDIICREPTVFLRNPPNSDRRQIIRRTKPNLPPHITRSITWVTQEANRGYNLTLHNATDNTVHNFPVKYIQGHWYTLIRHPTIPDKYYVYDDGILEHGQFGTGFPLRDDPYHPDYKLHLKPSLEIKARVTNSSENFGSIGCSMKTMKQ